MNFLEFKQAFDADCAKESAAPKMLPQPDIWDEIGEEIDRYPLGASPRLHGLAESRRQAAVSPTTEDGSDGN